MRLAASASLQLRIIFTLMMRRMKNRYATYRAGYLWVIVEPIIWIAVLKFGIFGQTEHQPPLGDSYFVFFTVGIIIALTFRRVANSISGSVSGRARKSLPGAQQLDVAYANWILEISTGMVAGLIMLLILGLTGATIVPANFVICAVSLILMALLSLGYGLTMGVALKLVPALNHFQRIISIAIFFSSGFTFLVDRMPTAMRNIVLWNPLLHAIEWFREGFYAGYICASLDKNYLITSILTLMLIGLAGERALRSRKAPSMLNNNADD